MQQLLAAFFVAVACGGVSADIPPALRVGRAGHAFDHLGTYGEQAEAAAESGATILYATGFGAIGYEGLPPEDDLAVRAKALSEYNRLAREKGVELSIGYLCATSIVRLETFDKHWTAEFRSRFKTLPSQWLQQDRDGKPLPSWYGGDYHPACMNNPDWQAYILHLVRATLDTGHDGVFFDNPTVHPEGCYCPHCMEKFRGFLRGGGVEVPSEEIEVLRRYAAEHPREFMRFRSITARGFLAHIRDHARTVNPTALVTCNNSLNTSGVLYAQSRLYGYNIAELSQSQDFVVVEDMATQPRVEAGRVFEYGPTYKQLHAIARGKPVVACTLAGGDYHTAPNLVRLAMAEAAANGASYLSWPTWPEEQRPRMAAAIRPQADLLRKHEALLNDATARADVVLFLPMRRWLETEKCVASDLAVALSGANVQYTVVCEKGFQLSTGAGPKPVFLVESLAVLTEEERADVGRFEQAGGRVVAADKADWLKSLGTPSVELQGPPTVRVVVRDQAKRTVVHLLNLNVERLSSFEDRVNPATGVVLTVSVPFEEVGAVHLLTADAGGTSGPLGFAASVEEGRTRVRVAVPRLEVGAILVIEAR